MKTLAFGICILVSGLFFTQNKPFYQPSPQAIKWSDSVFQTMTLKQKIGQLFMVAAYSNKSLTHQKQIETLIKKHHIGGLIFFQGTPHKQKQLTHHYQKQSKIPLLVAIDGEWGLAMRLDSTMKFPKQMTLGAIKGTNTIEKMGQYIAEQCRYMGIHINFAPVVDVNSNPKNPVIHYRSFGQNKDDVAQKSIAYIKGLQENGVMACGKHFPGHGESEMDSHLSLPFIDKTFEQMDNLELFPFKQTINMGKLESIMVAHLYFPHIQKRKQPSSLSPFFVDTLLKKRLNFKGLIFTDALNMKGVSHHFPVGRIEIKALKAGNDVLLFSQNVEMAMDSILQNIKNGTLSKIEIDKTCKKILLAKYKYIIQKKWPQPVEIHSKNAQNLNKTLFEQSVTLLKNKNGNVPVDRDSTLFLAIGKRHKSFQKALALPRNFNNFYALPNAIIKTQIADVLDKSKSFKTIVLSLNNLSYNGKKNYNITKNLQQLIAELSNNTNLVLAIMGTPYCLNNLPIETVQSILVGYENHPLAQWAMAKAILGEIDILGTLPVSTNNFKLHSGIRINQKKLRFKTQAFIDSTIYRSIKDSVFPVCQIFVMKNDEVLLNKSYGFHTYDKKTNVQNDHVYDLASLTKILSTVPILMQLEQRQEFCTNHTLGAYLPMVRQTPYVDLNITDILTHQAGLHPWIPFYKHTINDTLDMGLYCDSSSNEFSLNVAHGFFARTQIKDTIFSMILNTPLRKKKAYKYSDLGFYFFNQIIEKQTKTPQNIYFENHLAKPLGLHHLTYQPTPKIPLSKIVPTELDTVFRKQLIHGYVHDQGAAMMGGVSGHAGLFGNAENVGKMMNLFLKKGRFGGIQILDSNIVNYYLYPPFNPQKNRRAYGFDKPKKGYLDICSNDSFGHLGFTGTIAWVEPKQNLVYVFVCNRVHPFFDNKKLVKRNIRTMLLENIIEAYQH